MNLTFDSYFLGFWFVSLTQMRGVQHESWIIRLPKHNLIHSGPIHIPTPFGQIHNHSLQIAEAVLEIKWMSVGRSLNVDAAVLGVSLREDVG